jgi:hypothetical protein
VGWYEKNVYQVARSIEDGFVNEVRSHRQYIYGMSHGWSELKAMVLLYLMNPSSPKELLRCPIPNTALRPQLQPAEASFQAV